MGPSDALAPRLFATRGHLAIGLALMSLLVVGGGLWPFGPDAPVGRWFAVAGLLAALAALTPVLPRRPWTMPVTLAVGLLGAGVLLASCVTAEGLVVLSLGVITAAQLAAYAFPARDAALLLGLALAVMTYGMVAAPLPFHAMTWAVVTIMAVASTSLLGYVTNRLRQHATTDDLTGALTRGALLQRLAGHLQDAQRTGTALAVVSADVDDFKTVNDTRGHLAGDEVLASLVTSWRASLGPRACIGRVGGDEFVVVLPGRDRAAAERWVAGARAGCAQPWSAGIAVAGRTDTTRDLLDRADVALYAAKASRRSGRRAPRDAPVTP
ncbi:GGDEF domain-containing protein [Cellulomonas hominis]|uniref:Diguanylate cyclase (GGDEF)-like protein n=2 Tax=Cellulomonas hominis TaxID=156981 RepID=A0A7W8W9E0_9CELL|nr:GGDEF domain-containing protein [Cellulomonas hominis]MBB5471558.1 diguanylate cyclase (GGDEF)-like protein [Cellulomonas hominis]NKY06583.1 GGDEF domain-containing protein [Cellulomonas hominis]